ncbi:hypothetical protein C0389_08695 [bacterium]|nr:hypothetical protein [bacterium]
MNKLPEKIKTIVSESEFKMKEKGSSFVSFSKPVKNVEEALSFLSSLRKKYYDATHHCYSYQFVDGSFKYSDDGEPNGTAGKRIYNAQIHFELTNLLTVVARYYGGLKFGVGPLGKAYYESAFKCLETSKIKELTLHQKIEIQYEFEFSNFIHHLISKYSLIIEQNIFGPKSMIVCSARNSIIDQFSSELTTSSNQQLFCKKLDESLYL